MPKPRDPQLIIRQSPPDTHGLPESELSSYKLEMDSLMDRAKINQDASSQMRSMGALNRAIELLQKASRLVATSQCLRNQMKRGVPYYQGKATCATAVTDN